MSQPRGAPLKYCHLIEQLKDDELYIPATIADLAAKPEQEAGGSTTDWAKQRVKIRKTLSRFAKNRNFPPEGDGKIRLRGQTPISAWLGKRWKAGLTPREQ